MTISDHLEFSVLSAPLATIDRRGLSQAWYSALYGAGKRPSKAVATQHRPVNAFRSKEHAAEPPHNAATTFTRLNAQRIAAGPWQQSATACERREGRSPLARRIEQRFFRSGAPPQQATFCLGADGRVAILLRSRNGGLELVAICARRAQARVAAALSQARYALAMRGIAVDAGSVVERAR